ncbi:hypothetical protein H8K33_19205 [Undibacterium amnicola]|uniref:Uncharacterized protein n=1 Tax=Undibacterium amnicola TaxID=1834038 RepID=A0ABR6XW76_9BURK|nr:hypothetical protein [Undibacterium amnicola]MBC3833643.1 hypothetical protein [Undibacterium amnicola]
MGWFSNFCSSVGSAVSSIGSAVSNVASRAWEGAREIAGKAVSWMADKAENFVDGVKEVWSKVKPYVAAISPFLKQAAKLAPWPWLSTAITIFDHALQTLLKLEDSPVLKKIEAAINWTISTAKKLKETYLDPKEIEEANKRKEVFEQAATQVTGDAKHAMALASMINDYVKIQSVIKIIFEENAVDNFDHYLRLRATQKLLANVEQALTSASSIEEISSDDMFMLEVGAKLIKKNPTLSDADALRIDEIIFNRFNSKLLPFVFEEMIMAWEQNLESKRAEWQELNADFAKETVLMRRLKTTERLSELSEQDQILLSGLMARSPETQEKLSALEKHNREMKNYVSAAEGFLQVLEKDPEQLIAEGKEYLAEESAAAGMIIIDCAQNGKRWEDLTPEQQSLIIDYANIFEADCKQRLKKLIEIEVGA